MNPDQIMSFVQCLQHEKNFRTYYYGAYEGIQMIYERITGKACLKVDVMDENIRASIILRLDIEEKTWKRIREENDARRDRVLYLRRLLDPEYTLELAGWAEGMPPLPNSRPTRRGQKRRRSRSRSRFRERSGSLERLSTTVRTELGGDEPDPPGIQIDHPAPEPKRLIVDRSSSEEEVVVMIDEEDEYQEINTQKPILRKSVPDRRKKRKKSAGSGLSVRRSYDEMIEAPVYHSSDSELDLEIQFSEPMSRFTISLNSVISLYFLAYCTGGEGTYGIGFFEFLC